MNEPTETEIIARVRGGEIDAFELLVRRFNSLVYRTARSVLRDDAHAEECAQRAWIRAYERLDRFAGSGTFAGWIGQIVYREALAMIRATRRSRVVPIPSDSTRSFGDHELSPATSDEALIQREIREHLEPAIDALPAALREIFVLREVHELSVAETSHVLGLTEENVRVRLHRARMMLRSRIDPSLHPRAFAFDGSRCDRIVALVRYELIERPKLLAERDAAVAHRSTRTMRRASDS